MEGRKMTAQLVDRFRIVREDMHRYYGGSVDSDTIDGVVDHAIAEVSEDARIDTFIPVLVERQARESLESMGTVRKEILFASRHNSARAQLAYAFARHYAGENLFIRTVGIDGRDPVDPDVLVVLDEMGVSGDVLYEKNDTPRTVHFSDVVVLLGVDEYPNLPGVRYVEWNVADPAGKGLAAMRNAAHDIDLLVRHLLAELAA